MLCDVCGRNNADNLTFCQDCGRRLRQHRGVAPTPPNGMPKVSLASAVAVEPARESQLELLPELEPAPVFAPAEPVPEVPRPSIAPEGPHAEVAVARPAPPLPAAPPPQPEPARDARSAARAHVTCTQCGSVNPPEYRFCVTCGTPIHRTAAGGSPAASGLMPAPRPISSIEPRREPQPEPPPGDGGEQIIGAPVVDIASGSAVPAKLVICARCHGQSIAGTHFCKYCGASLLDEPAPSGRRPAIPPEPQAAALAAPQAVAFAPLQAVAFAAPQAVAFAAPQASPPVAVPRPAPQLLSPVSLVSAGRADDPSASAPQNGPPPLPRRNDPVGRVPLAPIGKQPPPMPVKPPLPNAAPATFGASGEAPRPAGSPPARQLGGGFPGGDLGVRTEVSQMAGSPIPAEPLALPGPPPRVVPGRWKGGRLVVIVEDGSEGRSFSLAEGQLDIGRTDGDIILEDDPYVSPRHARLRRLDTSWVVRDLDSTNHVYVRLRRPHGLKDGDLLLLGLEVLQFQTVSDGERGLGHAIQHGTFLFGSPATPRRARLCQRTVEGVIRDVYHVFRDETVIGREMGDVVFTADPFLSRRHAAIRRNPVSSEFSLVDLDSSNGTYVAIRGEVGITDGDFLRIGQHLFRVDLG